MTIRHHLPSRPSQQRPNQRIDLVSLAVLFVATVCIAIGLIAVTARGTEMWILIPPTLVGVWAILSLRK